MPSALASSRAPAYAALVCTTALWGSNGVVSRALMDTVPPLVMASARWAVVFVVLLPLVWPERRVIVRSLERDWKLLLALSLLGSAPQSALVYTGLSASTAINLGLLNSTIPVLIILISWGWYARRPRRLEATGLALSLAGVLLILAHGDLRALLHLQFNHGDLLMLGAMVIWAIYTLRLKDRPRTRSLFAFVFALSLIGELLTLPFAALQWAQAGGVHLDARECTTDRKSTRLNSSHTEIYTLSLHDALPIFRVRPVADRRVADAAVRRAPMGAGRRGAFGRARMHHRSEEHTSELQSHRDLHSFPTRRSSDLSCSPCR